MFPVFNGAGLKFRMSIFKAIYYPVSRFWPEFRKLNEFNNWITSLVFGSLVNGSNQHSERQITITETITDRKYKLNNPFKSCKPRKCWHQHQSQWYNLRTTDIPLTVGGGAGSTVDDLTDNAGCEAEALLAFSREVLSTGALAWLCIC